MILILQAITNHNVTDEEEEKEEGVLEKEEKEEEEGAIRFASNLYQ